MSYSYQVSALTRSGSTGSNASEISLGSRELLSEPSISTTPTGRGDSASSERQRVFSGSTGDMEPSTHRE